MRLIYNSGSAQHNVHPECVERAKMLEPFEHPNVKLKSVVDEPRDSTKKCDFCGSLKPNCDMIY